MAAGCLEGAVNIKKREENAVCLHVKETHRVLLMEKVKIVSDFFDYYDHHFDGSSSEITFSRMSRSGMARREMLEYLKSIGLKVPVFGRPDEVLARLQRNSELPLDRSACVVVHLDENAHCGEGKIRIPLHNAIEQYPDSLAVEYIPTPDGQACTWRYLQIGDKGFWLRYSSQNDWRSNCGDVTVLLLHQEKDGHHPWIKDPLFAVDFIKGDSFYAIDFNVAPCIRGTGVENVLPAKDAAEAIKRAIRNRK
jgi:hypothetical protein